MFDLDEPTLSRDHDNGDAMRRKFTTLLTALALSIPVATVTAAPASALPVGAPVSCNYGYYVYNSIAWYGNTIYNRQRQGTVTKERLHTNLAQYPGTTVSLNGWGYGWRNVDSTGYRGGEYVRVEIFDAGCV